MPEPDAFTPAVNCHHLAELEQSDPNRHRNRKKIFVFCDGTGNEFSDARSTNSNVVKLYTTLRVANDQVAYYHPGVGTMGDPGARHWITKKWSQIKGLAFAAGFQANVFDAYRYLMEVYNDGDEIYLFGFSRGSYTARALAGMLHGYGLLCRGNEGHLPYAWKLFLDQVKKQRKLLKKSPGKRGGLNAHTIEHNGAFAQTFSRLVTVRFIGVWDTVSSVGWIYQSLRLLDMAQNPIIQVVRHAVSIDERRAFYRDNLYGPALPITDVRWPEEFRRQGIVQDIAQVWFPGAHSDVGGSYPQDEAAPANEALTWMIGELQANGAELCQDRIDMVLGKARGLHAAENFYGLPAPFHKLHNSLDWRWWLLQLVPQQYFDKDDEQIDLRVPFGTPRKLPEHAIVHGSAVERIDNRQANEPAYHPLNLRREWLHPLQPGQAHTRADLTGCFVYRPLDRHKPTGAENFRRVLIVWIMAILEIVIAAAVITLLGILIYWIGHVILYALLRLCHFVYAFWLWTWHHLVGWIKHDPQRHS